ncbi:ABC transporter ATP-binding protein [Pseudonocardia spinosispora]|uniref:ABC transporter ATP-binding protein n=1 Tax=Pseudonocardia spinosispora TaxID=103441 RepID=UPI0003F505C8|nr:ABC transporter ATP-binding protein [Pseudonocardia spinosispora]
MEDGHVTARPEAGATPALELRGIDKSYGPVHANQDVSLTLGQGSVHAILGENGAGKSTLMKILFGVERPDAGTIVVDGTQRRLRTPADAIAAGIGMVFQHFGLVSELSVLDNISLGAERSGPLGVDRSAARRRIDQLAAELGLEVPTGRRVRDISIAQQQRVEILKALYRGARVLILDEPTALLAPQERLRLFDAIRRLQATGASVLFITHKLDEIEALADDVTVMRHGAVVARRRIGEVDRRTLVADMVGEAGRSSAAPRPGRTPGGAALTVRGLTVPPGSDGGSGLSAVDAVVRRGEVLGVVGIDGHGHQTFCQVLAGVRPAPSGTVVPDGAPARRWDRRAAMRRRIAYVPEDRLVAGVARHASIAENLLGNRLRDPRFSRYGLLRRKEVARHADDLVERFDIRCRDARQEAGRLSGGNVQKIVLARELSADPEVIVVCEPTRGLDIGAIAAVHDRLSEAAGAGKGVVVQSSDLDEVLAIADRILVFRNGRIVGEHDNTADLDVTVLGAVMLGTDRQEVA